MHIVIVISSKHAYIVKKTTKKKPQLLDINSEIYILYFYAFITCQAVSVCHVFRTDTCLSV